MKTLFKLLMLAGIIVYLVFTFTQFVGKGGDAACVDVNIVVTDSTHAGFITPSEVSNLLQKNNLYPTGKKMKDIDSKKIENMLLKNSFIKEVVCYKSPNNKLNILIAQRLPLLRIMAENGEDYYIDERGYVMDPLGYVADLAVATGNIDKNYAKTTLVKLGRFLRSHPFWDDQVEQINITKERKIDIVPRVGDQIIHLGNTDSIQTKFNNLTTFYEKVMPEVGWNKYKEINIEYPNQIVCIKRNKEDKVG